MITMRRYYQDPPIVTTPLDDVWAVIVPKARTNEVTNPSGELGTTTGYTAGAGSLTTTTTQQYHGARSFQYTPSAAVNDGFYYTLTSTIALRAISCKFLGQKGVPYALAYATTAPAELVTKTFVASGRWQWIWLYVNETSATTRRIYFRKNSSASTATFYVDGVQSEVLADASESVSTYIDGAQLGLVPNQQPPAYFWNGTPHASTSTRSGLTRAGGEVKFFRDYGFTLMAMIGLGLSSVQNVATEYARIDGGFDDYTRKPTHQFTLTGRFDGRSYDDLRNNRGGLAQLFDRDLVGLDQRLLLTHYVEDLCGVIATSTSRLLCKYQDGLGGNVSSQVAEQANITFTLYMPNVFADGESGSTLSVQTAISNASRIIQRSSGGIWANLSTGANNTVWRVFYAADGKLYAGGQFTSIGGVATNYIAYWDGSAWNAMGTGGTGGTGVYAIGQGPDGSLYVGGDFTGMGGIANTAKIAKWNGSAWSSITGGGAADDAITAMAIDRAGVLYVGGLFTTIGGTAANRVASYNGSAWSAMSTGTNGQVYAMTVSPGGVVYRGGGISGSGAESIDSWNGSTWTSVGAVNAGGSIKALAFAPNGTLYAGGSSVTSIGGIAVAAIGQWNGTAWTPMGTGLASGTGVEAAAIVVLPDGTVLVGGDITSAGGITTVPNLVRWNGSAWVYSDLSLAWGTVRTVATRPDGAITIGGDGATTTGTAAATTTITNTGSARTYPTVVIKGPSSGTSRIYQLANTTTGRTVYLNYTINAGETATFVFQPDSLSFTSDFQGNIANTILPGSNTAEFFLQPDANVISFFSADSSVTVAVYWRPAFASLDDVP